MNGNEKAGCELLGDDVHQETLPHYHYWMFSIMVMSPYCALCFFANMMGFHDFESFMISVTAIGFFSLWLAR